MPLTSSVFDVTNWAGIIFYDTYWAFRAQHHKTLEECPRKHHPKSKLVRMYFKDRCMKLWHYTIALYGKYIHCITENPLQSGDRKRFLRFIPISVKDCCYLYCKGNQETKWRKYSFLCFLFFPISSHLEEFEVRHVSFIIGENVVVVLFPTRVRLQR